MILSFHVHISITKIHSILLIFTLHVLELLLQTCYINDYPQSSISIGEPLKSFNKLSEGQAAFGTAANGRLGGDGLLELRLTGVQREVVFEGVECFEGIPERTPYDTLRGRHYSSVNALTKDANAYLSGWDICTMFRKNAQGKSQKMTLRDLVNAPSGFHNHPLTQQRISVDPSETQCVKNLLFVDMLALLCDSECNVIECNGTECHHGVKGRALLSERQLNTQLKAECQRQKPSLVLKDQIDFSNAETESRYIEGARDVYISGGAALSPTHHTRLVTQSYWFKALWPVMNKICETLPWFPKDYRWNYVYEFPRGYVSTEAHLEELLKVYEPTLTLGISRHNPTRYIDETGCDNVQEAFDNTLFLIQFQLKEPEANRVIRVPARVYHPFCGNAPNRCSHVMPERKDKCPPVYPSDYMHVPMQEIYDGDHIEVVLSGRLIAQCAPNPSFIDSCCARYSKKQYNGRLRQIDEAQEAFDNLPTVDIEQDGSEDEMNGSEFYAKVNALHHLLQLRRMCEPAEGWMGKHSSADKAGVWQQYLQRYVFGVNNPHIHELQRVAVEKISTRQMNRNKRDMERDQRRALDSDSDGGTDMELEMIVDEREWVNSAPEGWNEMNYMERRRWGMNLLPQVRKNSDERLKQRIQRIKDRTWAVIRYQQQDMLDVF